jgi:uncharacterized protein
LKRKRIQKIAWWLLIIFIVMNVVAFFHAYKFTHYSTNIAAKTSNPEKLTTVAKIKTLLFGINNPRPSNNAVPTLPYQTIVLQSNKQIVCWYIPTTNAIGTVILFHGYSDRKASNIEKSELFHAMGYNTLLVDFMGSGDSEGNQTTLGYKEAEEVKTCVDFIKSKKEKSIILFGSSMGAVAILKAINDYSLLLAGIIIECPFGSMYQTTCARFNLMHAPTFPMAGLLVFWGGIQNNFWAFGHSPIDYAKKVNCPTLLMYGEQDKNVSRNEIDDIYNSLGGVKTLQTFAQAGHENYLIKYKEHWHQAIVVFLQQSNKNKQE